MILLSAAQTMGLTGSEALLLARLGPARLPEAFVAAALVTVVGSLLYASKVGVLRNDRLFIGMLIGSAAVLAAAAPGALTGQPIVLIGLCCAFYLTEAVFINHFWTFSGDFFDTLTSKRLFPVFTVGLGVGGFARWCRGARRDPHAQPRQPLVAGWRCCTPAPRSCCSACAACCATGVPSSS
jgi:hypothetical protein